MIKDIVVNLSLGDGPDVATDFAVSAAGVFDAHLTGIAFQYEPFVPTVDMSVVPAEIIEIQRAENERQSTAARRRFEETARRNAISAEIRSADGGLSSAPDTFARIARRFDLSIVAQPQPEGLAIDTMFVEAALFGSGRPVLIVPYIQRDGLKLDRVMVCWDGSRAAARAAGDALPILAKTKTVEVVTITNASHSVDEIPGSTLPSISPGTVSTSSLNASLPAASTSPTPFCRAPPTSARTSSSWAVMDIRASANSCSAAPPADW